jgi:hypothetical protein
MHRQLLHRIMKLTGGRNYGSALGTLREARSHVRGIIPEGVRCVGS